MGANLGGDGTTRHAVLVDGRVAPLPGELPDGPTLESRILDATLVCIARWGMGKTTLDDIAREAGCGRATVYRVVPGGKDALMVAAGERELQRFLGHLALLVDAEPTAAARVAVAVATSARVVRDHAALVSVCEHEPEAVLPFVSFDALDPLLEAAAALGAQVLAPFLPPAEGRRVGEWVARIVVSYGFEPDERLDLTDLATATRFVARYQPRLSTLHPLSTTGSPVHRPATGRRPQKELVHVHH